MDKIRILVIGLEEAEVNALKQSLNFNYLMVHYDLVPQVKLIEGQLYVESSSIPGKYLLVNKVIFHGIYKDDLDFITLLAMWNGPCLPNALGMMDLRQRIPGLVRALSVSKFSGIKRGMVIGEQEYNSETEVVAKWGIWHCGEDKNKFNGDWTSTETSVIEEFIDGEAVRIMIVGDKNWQIRLTGDTWLKSIHNEGSWEMEIDQELLLDSTAIAKHFNLQTVGVDYIIGKNGERYLLEVNHIPNVTVFPFVNKAFIEYAGEWMVS
ncbi:MULTISPECIES: hypothetical protein [Mucilaginibacter]|jgi:hypothetical protein|uniref:hypothetical protein n=1 Tax=Mucilaginibacter TaxID=423349 RepID=UPI00087138A2|nr:MULTISPECIES: hypothetical protein [Mucilaginibacter]GGB12750.1 hypothetical protein GCM10011500_30860 [Mucilaginibacter rubeus]SCW65421.1 hypothetical protein SAMN03159284_02815 [Mucilaginibacter sp. NFR10]